MCIHTHTHTHTHTHAHFRTVFSVQDLTMENISINHQLNSNTNTLSEKSANRRENDIHRAPHFFTILVGGLTPV